MNKRQENLLRQVIRESVRGPDLVQLKSGKMAAWGSKQHLRDLETSLADLTRIRNYQSRGSASRENFNNAIKSLRQQFRAAKRYSEKLRPPKEPEIGAAAEMIDATPEVA